MITATAIKILTTLENGRPNKIEVSYTETFLIFFDSHFTVKYFFKDVDSVAVYVPFDNKVICLPNSLQNELILMTELNITETTCNYQVRLY